VSEKNVHCVCFQKMSQSKSREATSHPSEALPSQEKWWDLFQEVCNHWKSTINLFESIPS